jgi:Uncharacterised protein family UPF0547
VNESVSDPQTKVCPQCAEEVKAAARICRFCAYQFDPLAAGTGPARTALSPNEQGASRVPVIASTVTPAKSRAKAPWFIALGVVGVIVIGAVVMSGVLTAKHTLTGSLVVPAADNLQTLDWLGKITTSSGGVQLGGPCSASGVYSDISAGNDVTVRDETDRVVGTVALGSGALGFTSTAVCVFKFTVPDVPDAKFISVEVGHRGRLTFSAADLDTQHWSVQIQASEVGG